MTDKKDKIEHNKRYNDRLENLLNLTKVARNDGWYNALTGLGVERKDPRTGMKYEWKPLSELEVEKLAATDDIARRVVYYPPREATRKWINLRMLNDADPQIAKKINNELIRLDVQKKIREAWSWSRLYGGAAIFIAADDSKELTEPLDLKAIRKINALNVISRHEISASAEISNDLADPNWGKPKYYNITSRLGGTYLGYVHHTRLIKFEGQPLGLNLNQVNDYWGDSVLSAMLQILSDFNLAYSSAANVINDFRVGILKLKDLAHLVASDNNNALNQRIQLMQYSKSVLSAIALDADNEDFEQRSTPLAGVKDVLDQITKRLTAATEMPHTIVMGEGATGTLGGGGKSEDNNLAKWIHGLQEEYLTKPIEQILELIQSARMGPTNGKILEDLTWDFIPLTQPNEQEIANFHKTQAEADNIYWQIGVLDSEEIRNNRFGGDEYSMETSVESLENSEMEPNQEPKNEPIANPNNKSDSNRNDYIKKVAGSFFVYSEEGKKLAGPFKNKTSAEKRLREIEYFKNK